MAILLQAVRLELDILPQQNIPLTQGIFLILNITQRLRAIFFGVMSSPARAYPVAVRQANIIMGETEPVNIPIPRVFYGVQPPPNNLT